MHQREEQLCSLADYEPAKIKALQQCPIIDFYMILNARIEQNKKVKRDNKK